MHIELDCCDSWQHEIHFAASPPRGGGIERHYGRKEKLGKLSSGSVEEDLMISPYKNSAAVSCQSHRGCSPTFPGGTKMPIIRYPLQFELGGF